METSNVETFIAFHPEKCTQCMGCQSACKSWRKLPYGILYRKVINLWDDGNFPHVKNASLSLSCLHCVAPECIESCPVEAISKNTKNGLVEVDEKVCIGCRQCFEACPYDVPQFNEGDKMQKCDLCTGLEGLHGVPPCIATCPGKALELAYGSVEEKSLHQDLISRILVRRPNN